MASVLNKQTQMRTQSLVSEEHGTVGHLQTVWWAGIGAVWAPWGHLTVLLLVSLDVGAGCWLLLWASVDAGAMERRCRLRRARS